MKTAMKRVSEIPIDETDSKIAKIREKTRKYALLMMYSGFGYFGMQRNVGFKTIEGELLDALLKSNLIDNEIYESPVIAKFQRTSKTDKNVSAMGQLCSIKLPDNLFNIESINSKLPPEIRIVDIFRTTKNFHAKGQCKHRVYRYIVPTFAFAENLSLKPDELTKYRITEDKFQSLSEILLSYKGTKNYHNFTSGRKPEDASCKRFIIDMNCEKPFVRGKYEYLSIVVTGQSFMLHQIRKMIGLAIAMLRGYCNQTFYENAFTLNKYNIPKAPGLGLILDHVDFSAYNKRFAQNGERDAIDWSKYKKEIQEFSEKYIYSHISQVEESEDSMIKWLDTLNIHSFSRRDPFTNEIMSNDEVDTDRNITEDKDPHTNITKAEESVSENCSH